MSDYNLALDIFKDMKLKSMKFKDSKSLEETIRNIIHVYKHLSSLYLSDEEIESLVLVVTADYDNEYLI